MKDKLILLEKLCEQYGLYFVDFTMWHGHEWAYVGNHRDPTSYIEKLSRGQLEAMSPRQIEELVVECALTEMASNHEKD